MDKDIIVDKLKDLLNLVICIAVVLAIAYFSGFLKGFTPADFQEAFNNIISYIPGINKSASNSRQAGISTQGSYQPSRLSESVLRGAQILPIWRDMFASNTKVIFYVYDDGTDDKNFHYTLQNYIAKSPIKTSYNVHAYTVRRFKHIPLAEGGHRKICNSIQECNAQRQKSVDYTASRDLLERCGKTMCVINPRNKQFVKLRKRDSREAEIMLNSLRNW